LAVDDAPGSAVATVEYQVNDGAFQIYGAPFVVSAQGTTRITARAGIAPGMSKARSHPRW